jgi:hypothetical protein
MWEGWRRFVDQPIDAVDLHDPTVVGHGELSESVNNNILPRQRVRALGWY